MARPCSTCDSIGGLITSVNSEVLRDGQPIPGLYAAGEIANGQYFGNTYSSDGTMIGLPAGFISEIEWGSKELLIRKSDHCFVCLMDIQS